MRFLLLAAALTSLAAALPAPAAAQDPCTCARAACDALMDAQHQPHDRCTAMSSMPPAGCRTASAGMLAGLASLHRPAPAECAAPTPPTGGGGSDAPTPPTPPAPPGTGGVAAGGMEDASPPPAPLAADPVEPSRSPSGRLGCTLEHDGQRVIVSGASDAFHVKCSGIPLPGNALGGGAPATPPEHAADGRTVTITWNTPPGELSPVFANATWTAPATPPSPADVEIRATVTLQGANGQNRETVDLRRTVHVVGRHLTLELAAHVVTHCTPLGGAAASATIYAGFDLTCTQSIELEVADDLSVHGTGGTSCGAGTLANLQLCAPQLESSAQNVPGWTFDAASGHVDPLTGILSLQVSGHRVSDLRVHFRGGAGGQEPHPHSLFPRPLTMSPDDGATRSFGSLTTNAVAGGTNTFTIHAH